MFTICQDLYTIGAEGCFTRIGDITWRVSDCEELVAPHEWNNYVPN